MYQLSRVKRSIRTNHQEAIPKANQRPPLAGFVDARGTSKRSTTATPRDAHRAASDYTPIQAASLYRAWFWSSAVVITAVLAFLLVRLCNRYCYTSEYIQSDTWYEHTTSTNARILQQFRRGNCWLVVVVLLLYRWVRFGRRWLCSWQSACFWASRPPHSKTRSRCGHRTTRNGAAIPRQAWPESRPAVQQYHNILQITHLVARIKYHLVRKCYTRLSSCQYKYCP